jgi:hypothetical protein
VPAVAVAAVAVAVAAGSAAVGIWVQLLTLVVEAVSKQSAVDMTSGPVAFLRWTYRSVSRISDLVNWPSRWGYFHVGQVRQELRALLTPNVILMQHVHDYYQFRRGKHSVLASLSCTCQTNTRL